MAARVIFKADSFKSVENGFQFDWKCQYYRGICLSIVRDIKVNIDGEDIPREDISLSIHGEDFTLNEMETVIDADFRWEFGEWATLKVKKEGGLAKGPHHIVAVQNIAPSYMPFPWVVTCETDFEI
ncbi:MAG: DUF6379 domain-containing protein [Eubacteriales bacterium]|nr:DUF6379 domain-containing protein [Eubacteriales bacterium]